MKARLLELRRRLSEVINLEEARSIQRLLAKLAITEDRLPETIELVAGVDVAYARGRALAAAVVLSYEELAPIERKTACVKSAFPYIPTLLAFREGHAICTVIESLESEPDVYLIDGQGLAHPLRCGLATHVGVLMNVATIGVAKSLLCGTVGELKGGRALIVDNGEVVGMALETVRGKRPIYVSIGHKVSLERAVEIVLHCTKGHRLPEPLRMAHELSTKERRGC